MTETERDAILLTLLEKINSFESQFHDINAQFKSIDEKFKSIDEKFKSIDEHFKSIDEHFKSIDEHFKSIDEHLKNIDEHLEITDAKLEENIRLTRDINRSVAKIEVEHGEKLSALFDAFAIHSEKIDEIQEDIKIIKSVLDRHNDEIFYLKTNNLSQ